MMHEGVRTAAKRDFGHLISELSWPCLVQFERDKKVIDRQISELNLHAAQKAVYRSLYIPSQRTL
jgi:hypothetical protein